MTLRPNSLFPGLVDAGNKIGFKASDSTVHEKPVNVSKVQQLSPFRYPGGKTWLVPEVRSWLASLNFRPAIFVEPFAGGGIISLTVAAENLAGKIIISELDPDVASVWKTILREPEYLCNRILNFEITTENVKKVIHSETKSDREMAFRTIVKNRTQRGGIIAPGASLVKSGENGKGLISRWYPATLAKRIRFIYEIRNKIEFYESNAFEIIEKHRKEKHAVFFIDPPYTASGKSAGKRLYRFSVIDHSTLFNEVAELNGEFLMTYDDAVEVSYLASIHRFKIKKVPMKNTHHSVMCELLITKA
jgi:DNA adenine methylase